MKHPAVYIVTNQRNGTLYTGVTSNLIQRINQHKAATTPGFATKYGCKYLAWYEPHETIASAITREKQLKAGSRLQKLRLIETLNPTWQDLYPTLL